MERIPMSVRTDEASPVVDPEVDVAAGSRPAAQRLGVWRHWPVFAILGMAIVLTGFCLWSQHHSGDLGANGRFRHPPLYGAFHPLFSEWTLIRLVPTGLLLAAAAWAVTSSRRTPTWAALTLIGASAWVTSLAVNLIRGDQTDLWQYVSTTQGTNFTRDIHLIDEYGVRGFVSNFPSLFDRMVSWNARTHPPGVQVFLWVISKVAHGQPFVFSTILAFLSLGTAVGAWAMARSYAGERAGRIAAVLAVAAPGALMLAYSSMDAVFATVFTTAAAFIVVGTKRRSMLLTAAAGVVLGLGAFLTYAITFLAIAAAVAVVVETRSLRQSVKLLGAAAVGGIATLLVLRVALGYDFFATYSALPRSGSKFVPYFVAGQPAAVLIMAGLPLAALGLAGLVVKTPGARRPYLPAFLILLMFVWGVLPPSITGLRQGEVERTWAFLYPMLAASAAPVIAGWTRARTPPGRIWAGATVAVLVALSVAQAGVVQSLWDNYT
jgi:hypothetical protein